VIKILDANPASLGSAVGRLKYINCKKDLDTIKPGDIMFLRGYSGMEMVEKLDKIGEIITMGGILSHISVIAREFSLPCIANFVDLPNQYSNKLAYLNATNGKVKIYE